MEKTVTVLVGLLDGFKQTKTKFVISRFRYLALAKKLKICQTLANMNITKLIIYMKKFLHSDWLRAVQFLGNTVPKKEIQCQNRKFCANFFRF